MLMKKFIWCISFLFHKHYSWYTSDQFLAVAHIKTIVNHWIGI